MRGSKTLIAFCGSEPGGLYEGQRCIQISLLESNGDEAYAIHPIMPKEYY